MDSRSGKRGSGRRHWHRLLPKGRRTSAEERVGAARPASTVSVRVQPRLRPRWPLRRGQVPAPIDNSVAAECRGGPRRFAEHVGRTGREGGNTAARACAVRTSRGAQRRRPAAPTARRRVHAPWRLPQTQERARGRRSPLRLRTREARRLHHCARRVRRERGNETKSGGKGAAAAAEEGTKRRGAKERKTIKTKPAAAESKRAPRNKRRETSRTTAAARGPCGRDPPRPPCWFCGTGAWFARPVVGDLTAKHIFHSKLITASSYLLPRRLPTGYTFTQEKVITALLISLSGSFD